MLSTPFICCSIGVERDCSIVTASAPVYVVETIICGGTISGNCASGNPIMAMRPPRMVMIAITIATIGRLMKKFEIIYTRAEVLLKRLRVDDHAGAYFFRPLDDKCFSRFHSLLDC